jgi:hypothetical protein
MIDTIRTFFFFFRVESRLESRVQTGSPTEILSHRTNPAGVFSGSFPACARLLKCGEADRQRCLRVPIESDGDKSLIISTANKVIRVVETRLQVGKE